MGTYDIIIVGAGAAGLLLADALGKDPFFRDQSILLLEKDSKSRNDRTWCFWEAGKGKFDPLLYRSWDHMFFGGQSFRAVFPIAPYSYKMMKGLDFYESYLARIHSYPNLTLINDEVVDIREESNEVIVKTVSEEFSSGYVFNSVFSWDDLIRQSDYPVLQQHFIGWFVRTDLPVFDQDTATFMDFSIPQQGNTRFMYVLPFSRREALVEYTLFSESLLNDSEYERAIENYLQHTLGCSSYEIIEKEKGRIPMSGYNFASANTDRVLHIGTAGGWAKPSTGFTFMNTSRKVDELADHLKNNKQLSCFSAKNRFWWYDLLLLDILARHNDKGSAIFEALFRKRKAPLILKFLDEKTSVSEDLRVIWACPKNHFALALFRRLLKGLF